MTPDLETLYPYQEEGAAWLAAHPNSFLADDMGLGKSCQAVRACDLLGAQDILVLCPSSVRVNWEREFEKFSPFSRPCTVLYSAADPIPATGVVVVCYELLPVHSTAKREKATWYAEERAQKDPNPATLHQLSVQKGKLRQARKQQAKRKDFLSILRARKWDALVLDEAHYLANRTAGRTRVVYGHGSKSPGLDTLATNVWRLSGTPANSWADELYTHLRSMKEVNQDYWSFTFRYCKGFESDYGYKITGHQNTEELKAILRRCMLRRTKEQVAKELPPIVFQQVAVERCDVELDPDFYEVMHHKTKDQFFAELSDADKALRAALDLATNDDHAPNESRARALEAMDTSSLTTLRRYIAMAKLPSIVKLITEELEANAYEKIVLFAVHQTVIEGLRRAFRKYGAVTLYGQTPPITRQKNIDAFTKNPHCRVFIGNIRAAGVGINGLQEAANEVGFVEQDWTPSANAQAAMRVHRNGQKKPVRVRIFSLHQSVDDQVQQTLLRKVRELARIF